MEDIGLDRIPPRIVPVLDSRFRPAVLANHAFRERVRAAKNPRSVRMALEQSDGSVYPFETEIFAETDPRSAANFACLERLAKFLLWSRGGFRIHFAGPQSLAERLQRHFQETPTGRFDSHLIGERIYGKPIEVVRVGAADLPTQRVRTQSPGWHLEGCRIGFDLGGSDRKVAAVIDGNMVFSEETAWDPCPQPDPQYHFDGIMDSLKRAAAHLPRVDAIGGSAAGVYVNNQVKVASLFRGVPQDLFDKRVRNLFFELQRAWNGVPFEVINDGEVAALAGAMALGKNAVLGLALGTSMAAGYVTRDGTVTSWLNELAFAPVDYNPQAARDEWSGDYGVGAQYFSQQAVGRLLGAAGIGLEERMPLPEALEHVQELMAGNDRRARQIYETLGTYLGYGVAHYADFYDFEHVLLLGRVMSGPGGDLILRGAEAVLQAEFPGLAGRIRFHLPDEKNKRHGQAVAAASLPHISK
ncbi:MAG: ROK family protein [Verrucomicrobiota bacterium]|jgi:predicted NBD/HSP70 family sugar kinase